MRDRPDAAGAVLRPTGDGAVVVLGGRPVGAIALRAPRPGRARAEWYAYLGWRRLPRSSPDAARALARLLDAAGAHGEPPPVVY